MAQTSLSKSRKARDEAARQAVADGLSIAVFGRTVAGQPPELPINVINDRLGQARATLDLIHTGLNDSEFADGLYNGTLAHAVHSAILRIEEAMEAAETMHHAARS
jgi:hypothetical protein